jgi:hypothetical protein
VSEPYDPKADADLVIAEAGHFKPGYHGGMMTTDFIAAAERLARWAAEGPPGDTGRLWLFLRDVLAQGAAIQQDYAAGNLDSYEAYAARLDAAARERESEPWLARRAAGAGDDGPVDGFWLESNGFSFLKLAGATGSYSHPAREWLARVVMSDPPWLKLGSVEVCKNPTRRQVLSLLAALGAAPAGESRPTEE